MLVKNIFFVCGLDYLIWVFILSVIKRLNKTGKFKRKKADKGKNKEEKQLEMERASSLA